MKAQSPLLFFVLALSTILLHATRTGARRAAFRYRKSRT